MKYYELRDDVYYPERWYLGDIIEVEDNWQFIYGERIDESLLAKELHIKVNQDGKPMDYTTSEAYSVPLVSERIKIQMSGVKGLQFIPVTISNKEVEYQYYIMVVTDKLDCVNEELSVFGKFVKNDPVRPDKEGHYSWFTNLTIDKGKAKGKDVFRIDKTAGYLVVSEKVKEAMENINATGTKFIEV